MAQTPTSKNVLKNNAAKDDHVGLDGDFNFTISDLLANDPGGAAKDVTKQFFFGDVAPNSGIPSIQDQVGYLHAHGITAHLNAAGTAFVSFDIGVGATDINYFAQMGNNGTWSQAHVDVDAPPPPPPPQIEVACDALLFADNFDGYVTLNPGPTSSAVGDLAKGGWSNMAGPVEIQYRNYGGETHSTSGNYWVDTQASPSGIDISHTFNDTSGGKALISFDLATENYTAGYGPGTLTSADASFDVLVDGHVVKHITAAEIRSAVGDNVMNHYDIVVNTGAVGNHTLELKDTSPTGSNFGFALDTLAIHDLQVTNNLFTENFDGYTGTIFKDAGVNLFEVTDLNADHGWTGAQHTELGANGYGGIVGTSGGTDGFWLDTQNSPGGIDVSHTYTDATGGKALLSFDVATQSLDYQGNHYNTDPDASFTFKVDGSAVATYTTAQIQALAGGDDKFAHIQVLLDDGSNPAAVHTLELVDNSKSGFTGFAIDSIKIDDVCEDNPQPSHRGADLFTENFDEATTQTFTTNNQLASGSIDLTLKGWTGTGHDDNFGHTTTSEVGMSDVLGSDVLGRIHATTGDHFLDTQNTPGGIDISHTFTDGTGPVGGKTSVLSFDVAKMDVNWDGHQYQTDPNASFAFKVDGATVKSFSASEISGVNTMNHFDVDIAGYANLGNQHTLELVDMTDPLHTNYFGFAIDSVQIHDWIV